MKRRGLFALMLPVLAFPALAEGLHKGTGGRLEPVLLESDLKRLPPRFQEAYLFAIVQPQVLSRFPCYCGCNGSVGHTSNRDCFLFADGTLNAHGSGCDICVDVALTAKREATAGIPTAQTLRNLNQKYKEFPRMPGFPG